MSLLNETEQIYVNERVIQWLRHIPRFGHSNSLAYLASDDQEQRQDYVDGIISFSILVAFLALLWVAALFVLKYFYGKDRVGCAAGGAPVHLSTLRRSKLSRSRRKSIIVRNWRTQAVFLFCSLLLPTLSFVFVNHGLKPFLESLTALDEVAYAVGTKNQEAAAMATNIEQARDDLVAWGNQMNGTEVCPNYWTSPFFQDPTIQTLINTLAEGINSIDQFVDQRASDVGDFTGRTARAVSFVEEKVETTVSYEELVEGFLVAINIVNVFLFFGALLSRNNIDSQRYQKACTYIFVPAFGLLLIGVLAATCTSSVIGILNADFCSGGQNKASPQGTFMDILTMRGLNDSHVTYRALDYYLNDCSGANPAGQISRSINQKVAKMTSESQLLQITTNAYDLNEISAACGSDLTSYHETIGSVEDSLLTMSQNLENAENLTSCGSITPIFQMLDQGPLCTDSVEGLSCMLGTTSGMIVLGLIMLSTRAALYNPIIRPRRKKRREREFKEYVEHMGEFYNTSKWTVDASDLSHGKDEIRPAATFETAVGDDLSLPNLSSPSSNKDEQNSSSESGHATPKRNRAESSSHRSSQSRRSRNESISNEPSLTKREDPEVEYYSSDSESEESIGAKTNVSVLVSRFFSVHRESDNDSISTVERDLNTSVRSLKSLLGPASHLWPPIKRKASKSALPEPDVALDDSLDLSIEPEPEPEPSTPVPEKFSERRHRAPLKPHRALLRTHGGSRLPSPPRTDHV